MKTEHSPTPWASSGAYIDVSNGLAVADTLSTATGNATRYANSARIAACVNACEGVSNEQLTGMRVAELVAQRDELLAALKSLLSVVSVRIDDPRINQFDAARAAIAKSEGVKL